MCDFVSDVLYYAVDLYGRSAYDSAQQKACSCIPDDQTTGTQLIIRPKTAEIDTEQSKSIYQNIKDNFAAMQWKFIDLLKSSPILKSVRFIVIPAINFLYGFCENFGVTPLKAEAGWMDILSFLKECFTNALAAASNAIFSQANRLIGGK